MRERLTILIGKQKTDELRMGTFHALCALFLRKYASVVGLEGNFTVCDADERYVIQRFVLRDSDYYHSKKIIAKLLKQHKDTLSENDITLKEATVLSLISKAKSKGTSAEDMAAHIGQKKSQTNLPTNVIDQIVSEIYNEYERTLRRSNCLDFDDLLVFGVKLFERHKKAVQWCRHVLVDELYA